MVLRYLKHEVKAIKIHIRRLFLKIKKNPMTIHTETIYDERVWEEVKKFVLSGKRAVWFVLTPVDFEFVKVEHRCKLTKNEYKKTILKRYKWLQEHDQEIQLHIHTRIITDLYCNDKESVNEQEKLIGIAVGWMQENGFHPDKIAFGWFSYDNNSLKICKKYSLHVVKEFDYYCFHDFDLIRKKNRPELPKY